MAQIYEPRNPRARSPIIGEGVKRTTGNRQGVHVLVKPPKKDDKKPVLKRGIYNG
jgi:hypothetical protein